MNKQKSNKYPLSERESSDDDKQRKYSLVRTSKDKMRITPKKQKSSGKRS